MTWIYNPRSSVSSAATGGLNWASVEFSEALALSVTWRGRHTPAPTWLRRCKRLPWLRLLSGLTSAHSTRLESGPTSSPQGSRASLLAPQESVDTPTTSAGSGQMSLALSASAGRAPSSSNAPQGSDAGACLSSCETLPGTGTMRRGRVTRAHLTREHRTGGRGSSSWPTPTASSYGTTNNGKRGDGTTYKTAGKPSLDTMARRWPTPAASDCRSSGRHTTTTGVMHPGTSPTDAVRSRQDQTTTTGGDDTSLPVVLNPAFVEALQGLPIGWTGFASSATESAPVRQHRRSES